MPLLASLYATVRHQYRRYPSASPKCRLGRIPGSTGNRVPSEAPGVDSDAIQRDGCEKRPGINEALSDEERAPDDDEGHSGCKGKIWGRNL